METNTCSMGNTEKHIEDFSENYAQCRYCNTKRAIKRYYNKKDKILQQQKEKYMHLKDLVESYVELQNKLKALEEKTISR